MFVERKHHQLVTRSVRFLESVSIDRITVNEQWNDLCKFQNNRFCTDILLFYHHRWAVQRVKLKIRSLSPSFYLEQRTWKRVRYKFVIGLMERARYDPNVNTLYENFLYGLIKGITFRHAHNLNPEANFVGWRPIVNGEAQPYTFYTSLSLV